MSDASNAYQSGTFNKEKTPPVAECESKPVSEEGTGRGSSDVDTRLSSGGSSWSNDRGMLSATEDENDLIWNMSSQMRLDWDGRADVSMVKSTETESLSSVMQGIAGKVLAGLNDTNVSNDNWKSGLMPEMFDLQSTSQEYNSTVDRWGGLINPTSTSQTANWGVNSAIGTNNRKVSAVDNSNVEKGTGRWGLEDTRANVGRSESSFQQRGIQSSAEPIGSVASHRRSASAADSITSGGGSDGKPASDHQEDPGVSPGEDRKEDERSQPDGAEVQNKDELIERLINSHDGWGRKPVRQDIPWQTGDLGEPPTQGGAESMTNPTSASPAAVMMTPDTTGLIARSVAPVKTDEMFWNAPKEVPELYWNGGPGASGFNSADFSGDGNIGTWGSTTDPANEISWIGGGNGGGGSSSKETMSMPAPSLGVGDLSFLNQLPPGGGFNKIQNDGNFGNTPAVDNLFGNQSWKQHPSLPLISTLLAGRTLDTDLTRGVGSSTWGVVKDSQQSFIQGGRDRLPVEKIGHWNTPSTTSDSFGGVWGQSGQQMQKVWSVLYSTCSSSVNTQKQFPSDRQI